MGLFKKITISILLVAALSACGGGGGGGNTPTDPSLVFSLFPPDYFGGAYSDSYSLSGSDNTGDGYTATIAVQSGSTATFNAQSVLTIDQQVTITNTTTNAVGTGSSESYFSTDLNNLMAVGAYNITDNITALPTSVSVIPLTGSIGDFGNIGSYALSDGTSTVNSWALQDGFNGNAKLVTTYVARDSLNALDYTEIDTYTINEDGSIIRVNVVITLHQLGNITITLSGS